MDRIGPTPDRHAEQNRQDIRKFKSRTLGMAIGFVLFAVFLGLGCYYTTIDEQNHLHYNLGLFIAAIVFGCVFLYHMCTS